MMFISDKDCAEIMGTLRRTAFGYKNPAAPLKRTGQKPEVPLSARTRETAGQSVSYPVPGTDIVYSENVTEKPGLFSVYEQLTFGEAPPEQIVFSDSPGGQRGGAP